MKIFKENHLKFILILMFSCISVLSFYRIYSEFYAMQTIINSVQTSANNMLPMWRDSLNNVFFPLLTPESTMSIEHENEIQGNKFSLNALYDPKYSRVTASLKIRNNTNNDGYHIYADKENVGISANGINGIYYSIPMNKILENNIVNKVTKNYNIDISSLKKDEAKYAKALFKLLVNARDMRFNEEYILKKIETYFSNCRFFPVKHTYIDIAKGRVRAQQCSFNIKTKYINSLIQDLNSSLEYKKGDNVMSVVVDRINTASSKSSDKYSYFDFIIYDGNVHSAKCEIPYNSDTINIIVAPDYNSGFVECDMLLNNVENLINIRFNPGGDIASLSVNTQLYNVKFKLSQTKFVSFVKKAKKDIFSIELTKNGSRDSINVELEIPDNNIECSFRIYDTDYKLELKPTLKPVKEIGVRDTLNILSLINLAGYLKII